MKTLAAFLLLLSACGYYDYPAEQVLVAEYSGAPLLPAPPPPPEEPYLLAEHPEDPAFTEILPGDAKLEAAWPKDAPPRLVIRKDCPEETFAEALAIAAKAGQDFASAEYVDALPAPVPGTIQISVNPEKTNGKGGFSAGLYVAKTMTQGEVWAARCHVGILAHELLHTLGFFGHSEDPTHVLFFRVGGTVVSQGESAQLLSR